MAESRIVVLGSVNVDLVIRSRKLPAPGETVLGGEFYQAAGGKGANQAVAAARAAREPVTFIGAVGDDSFGRQSLANFARENLVCQYIKTVPNQPTGVALILVDERGENLISVASGANLHLLRNDVDAVPDKVFAACRVFLACLESPLVTVARGLERARRAGALTILNPAPATEEILREGLLSLVDMLTPNEIEVSLLSGLDGSMPSGAARAARKLQAYGCPRIVVTLGPSGCVVVEDEATHIPALAVQAIDTTAAGDAFSGALAVALSEGKSLAEAARWASRAGAIAVTRRGAQPSLPSRDEIDKFDAPSQTMPP